MALDRDDADEIRRVTAMRFTAALLSAGRHTATDAVTAGLFAADELLSRLRPVAPASGAPAPSPSPASTPAAWVPGAYVPKVGDKVEFDAVFTDNKSGVVVAVDEARQVASIVRFGEAPSKPKWERYFYDVRLIGVASDIERINAGLPATSSERAAAGLPVDESASESAEADRAFDALVRERDVLSLKHYELFRAGWLARARVAAKGGA